ncbi:MAG: GAF domain-containing protein [Deltaproteobacteria bacterium]
MKIKTRLRLNTWIYIIVILLIAISLTWSFWDLGRVTRNEKLVLAILETAFERISLRDDYLLYQEERTSIQWQAKSETLRRLLETAHNRFTTAEDKALLKEVQQRFDMTFSAFLTIIEKKRQGKRSTDKTFAFDEAKTRLISQVFLNSYALIDNIERLYESTERKAKISRNRAAFMIIFFFVGGGMVIVINSTLLNRTLTNRMTLLACGIKIIGDGNLDHSIVTAGDDELTDLARASNAMAAKLKQSYTSVENLRQEMAQRQRIEENLTRTNRVLAVISKINQMVISIREQEKLFAESCRIAVEYGKFRMAWVGLIDEENKMVKPVAWNGFEEGYLTRIKKISVNDITEGRGPTGLASREGKLFYCNDIANDPIMTPWREEALKRDYHSSIALPIVLHNRVIGVLTIYDAVPFFFNEDEINLLMEVTGNINHALEIIEIEKKRQQAENDIKQLNEELEERVLERTAELERINKVFVNRELRMRELKEKIAELEGKT